MSDGMPRKLDQYVVREYGRDKTTPVYYFRRGKGKRIRLPAPGTPDYEAEYQAARSGTVTTKPTPNANKTLRWLIARYRDSSAYRGLSDATRRQRDNIFKGIVTAAGHVEYRRISRRKIVEGREDRATTPAQARNFLDAMRGLFRWALEAEMVTTDPTAGVKNPSRQKGDGFAAWTDDDIEAYEARWPAGTKERVWLHVLLFTGLRRGDAVVLGRQHVKDGVATLRTEKTGMEVNIPILPELAATLAAGPVGDLAYIVGENGRPLTKETFGNFFRAACNAAGIKKSAHGVRKIGATRAAESGLTVNELEALFGWTGGTMASHYTKTADRKRLALAAAEKIRNRNAPDRSADVRGKAEK